MRTEDGAKPPTMAVLTPSYAPDLELCRELNRSVLAWTPPDVHHHIVVPRRDEPSFDPMRGPRTHVMAVDELLPPTIRALPVVNFWVNLRHPWMPVRGWMLQQIVKLRAAAKLGAELILLADSDVVFLRPVSAVTFLDHGAPRFYAADEAVHGGMPDHRRWHAVARSLLGLPPRPDGLLTDYVSPFNLWTRGTVLALCDHLERVHRRPWGDVLARELSFSEFILYGVFVDDVLGPAAGVVRAETTLCHTYWPSSPLSADTAAQFMRALRPDDLAVMVSAKSRTPLALRRAMLSAIPAQPALVKL